MKPAQQALDDQREMEKSQKQVGEMVLEGYHSIALGRGRDCNEFFEELEKKYENFRESR